MAFNVLELITRAYNAANINPQGYRVLTPEQSSNGLFLLNVLLSDKTVDTSMLLYWEKYDGVFEIGEGQYFIERLIQVETLTFFLDGQVRYPTLAQGLDIFMGSARAENVDSLPFTYYPNKVLGGTDLYVYYKPSQEYPFQIWGQFELQNVTLFEDLETKFPLFYINFLKLQLAKYLCIDGGFEIPIAVAAQLEEYRQWIALNGTVQDLSMKITNTISQGGYINWGQVNIGKAYTPGAT